jgi:DNA-binding LacI/PurR family transcriptional regulator
VDGIVAFDMKGWPDELKRAYTKVAVVNIGAYCMRDTDYVSFDLYQPAKEAVNHLFSLGCRRVAYVVPRDHMVAPHEQRMDAYRDLMHEIGRAAEFIPVEGPSR